MSQPEPPLDCSHEEFCAFHATLKDGERVIEMGKSCMTGEKGTVIVNARGTFVKWDTEFQEGSGMVTSVTGGTRRLTT